ncbi:IS256-like element ISRm5 family transposase [soil metagenome]
MTHHDEVYQKPEGIRSEALEEVMELLQQGVDCGENPLAGALRILLNEAMRLDRAGFLGAGPYQRSEQRIGYANGYKPKTLVTRLGGLAVAIPQVRGRNGESLDYYPSALEKGVRSERALKLVLAEMYLQGVSTRKVTRVLQEMTGLEVSSTQVSRCVQLLDEELDLWRNRPLGRVTYLMLDARYEKVRVAGCVVSCAVLIAVGVTDTGHRSVLGVSVSLSEAEVHWRDFLESLQARGMVGVEMVVSDSHAGLKAALACRLTNVPWQRCQFHLQQNAGHQVSRQSEKKKVAAELREILQAPSSSEALERLHKMVERYAGSVPRLSRWLEENVPESLTVLQLPLERRRLLRTSNGLEHLNKEIKRRTRVAGLFPNEASLLRLVSAILMETSEEWESGRVYMRLDHSVEP